MSNLIYWVIGTSEEAKAAVVRGLAGAPGETIIPIEVEEHVEGREDTASRNHDVLQAGLSCITGGQSAAIAAPDTSNPAALVVLVPTQSGEAEELDVVNLQGAAEYFDGNSVVILAIDKPGETNTEHTTMVPFAKYILAPAGDEESPLDALESLARNLPGSLNSLGFMDGEIYPGAFRVANDNYAEAIAWLRKPSVSEAKRYYQVLDMAEKLGAGDEEFLNKINRARGFLDVAAQGGLLEIVESAELMETFIEISVRAEGEI